MNAIDSFLFPSYNVIHKWYNYHKTRYLQYKINVLHANIYYFIRAFYQQLDYVTITVKLSFNYR